MIMTNKLLPVALVAALIGGSVGAFVMHSRNQPAAEAQTTTTTQNPATTDSQYVRYQANDSSVPSEYTTTTEQSAYKNGFADGFRACESGAAGNRVATSSVGYAPSRVVYRNSGRTVVRNSSSPRRVYYDYQRPRSRSFWQKHRDKLTVAMGTGAGAVIGGLVGGKKGAVIGALGGAGGSALYTYKIRNRNRRY